MLIFPKRFHIERGIASLAANTAQIINIKDAHNDPRFDKLIDKKTGVITRSILCMPIIGKDRKVLGVVQLLNKKDGFFTSFDEDLFKIFASYCSIVLSYTRLIDKINKTVSVLFIIFIITITIFPIIILRIIILLFTKICSVIK